MKEISFIVKILIPDNSDGHQEYQDIRDAVFSLDFKTTTVLPVPKEGGEIMSDKDSKGELDYQAFHKFAKEMRRSNLKKTITNSCGLDLAVKAFNAGVKQGRITPKEEWISVDREEFYQILQHLENYDRLYAYEIRDRYFPSPPTKERTTKPKE